MTIRRIFFYPYTQRANRYASLQLRILEQICTDIRPVTFMTLLRNLFASRGSLAILNFFEDRPSYFPRHRNRALLTNLATLLLLRLTCERIVWVRHNFWPHDLPRKSTRQQIVLFALNLCADTVVTHRNVEAIASAVVPHPLYFEETLPQRARDIEFLYFGAIKPYKGLDTLLSAWPAGRRLLIVGDAPDPILVESLHEIISERQLDVEMQARFIGDAELDDLLLRTKFCLMPHRQDTMIVAGSFYHAASLGANVLARNTDFGSSMAAQYSFVRTFEDDTLDATISDLAYVEPSVVLDQIRTTNDSQHCRDAWKRALQTNLLLCNGRGSRLEDNVGALSERAARDQVKRVDG
jgi:glycosyltransferase involved in cell wall biosynthesis